MTQEGSEHLDEGVERQEGDLYDHKDFFLPLGFMVQCDLVSEKTNMVEKKWLKGVSFGSRVRKFQSQLCHPLTENCKIQSKRAHFLKACSIIDRNNWYLTSLCLSFLIWKVMIIVVFTS